MQLQDFLELERERGCRMKLHKDVFAYYLQKVSKLNISPGLALKPLREFLMPSPAQLADNDPSKIYYLEILDENADSEETMAVVSDLVQEKMLSESQQWVVLVGDGKTFEHLKKVKRMYGQAYEKLLIFPGDWHLLKNFQPVLIKAYYHAGLKEIAKGSGYRAETLKSLEKCSHFKRTHSFLMQVWEALLTEIINSFVIAHPQFSNMITCIQSTMDNATTGGTSPLDLLLSIQQIVTA